MSTPITNQSEYDFSMLKAVFVNCTLKKSPQKSHTQGLVNISQSIMEQHGVEVKVIRPVDYHIPPGVYPDMTEHGYDQDDRPQLFQTIINADIMVLCTPIWLGDTSSICKVIIERLYAHSSQLNDQGQYRYYGRVGGCLITGNEDGIKHCGMNLLYSLQHIGYTIPPQADAGWIGEVGPGPSYLDEGSGGPDNDFTNRNTTFMTRNLMHMARMLHDQGGIPAYGNQLSKWKEDERFGFDKSNIS